MIKMFASDLDGTLLNALHEADGTIRRAIRELTEAGLHVVPATGRSTLPIGEHGFTGLALDACCSNGSIVRDSHGEVLKTWTIGPQVTEELLKAFPDICFDCSTPDGMYSSGSFEMHQAGFKKDSPIKRIVMRGMRARGGYHEEQYFDQSIGDILRHDVCKINCRVTSPELERDLKAYLAERSDHVVNAPFDPVMFEITDVACNKGESVAWLAGYYGIAEDEVAVYGDGGNVRILEQRLRWRGIPVEVRRIQHGEAVDFSQVDLVFMGGGPDREQKLASEQLLAMRDELAAYVEGDGPLLAICGGYQILGRQWLWGDELVPGLGLIDMETRRPGTSADRLIDNMVLESPLAAHPVVGYENHAGRTYLGEGVEGFGRVVSSCGHGNNDDDRVEGARYKNVVGTYSHGPLLSKNPEVADWLLARALERRAERTGTPAADLAPLDDSAELAANASMVKRLS